MAEFGELFDRRRYLRVLKMIVEQVKRLEVNQAEEAVIRVDGAVEKAAAQIEPDNVAGVAVALDSVPLTAIACRSFACPGSRLRIGERVSGSKILDGQTLLKLQQGRPLIVMAKRLREREPQT